MSITTYEQAKAIAAEQSPTRIVSYSNGRSRTTRWIQEGDRVLVTLHSTIIAKFTPDLVSVHTGGFNTLTTFDGLNATLGLSGGFYTKDFVGYYGSERMTEGMLIGYDGVVIAHTETPTPERRRR